MMYTIAQLFFPWKMYQFHQNYTYRQVTYTYKSNVGLTMSWHYSHGGTGYHKWCLIQLDIIQHLNGGEQISVTTAQLLGCEWMGPSEEPCFIPSADEELAAGVAACGGDIWMSG